MAIARGVRAQSTNEAVVYFGNVDYVTRPQEHFAKIARLSCPAGFQPRHDNRKGDAVTLGT